MRNRRNKITRIIFVSIGLMQFFIDMDFIYGQYPSVTNVSMVFQDMGDETTLPIKEVDLLIQYLRYPSVSGHEKEAGLFIRAICERTGLHIRQFGDQDGNFNFAASVFPLESGKPNLIFLNHIDVVPAGNEEEWQQHPYGGFLINNEVWGRGAFDNKGVAVMQLAAIARSIIRFRRENAHFNITFLAVSCEETQCEGGARYVVENHLDELNAYAVIGEGPPSLDGIISSDPDKTVFGIATGHKSAFWLKLNLDLSTSGHGSVTPHQYSTREMVFALERLLAKKPRATYTPENLEILRNLGRMEGGIKGFILKKPRLFKAFIVPQLRKKPEVFALFTNTVTLTNISNPTSTHNAIPSRTTSLLDCRLLPDTPKHHFLQKLTKQLDNGNIIPEVVMQTPGTRCTPVSHAVYQWLKQAIQDYYGPENEVVPLILPNLNDSGWFRARGVPVFDVVPGRISRQHIYCVHNSNERMPLTTLSEGIEVFTRFLDLVLNSGIEGELAATE